MTVEEEIRETFTAPGTHTQKTLFICEELGGVGGHKVADEFQKEKNVSRTDFISISPAHRQPYAKPTPLLPYSLEARTPAA